MRARCSSRGRAADSRLPVPADRSPCCRGRDRARGQRQEGPVLGALGHGERRRQDYRRRQSQCAGDRARGILRLQYARLRHACAADPRAHHRRAGDLRRHSFRAAAGRAGHILRRRTRIRSGAGARGGRRRRGWHLHRDPPGPRSSAVRRTQYGASQADGRAAAAPGRIRPTREELKINSWKLSEFDHPARPENRRPRGFAQTLFTRAVEPVIPMIADDLAIDVKTAALLSSAYTFPYALVQPALGVTGDFFGKTRLMNLCLLVIAVSALVCAVATNFSLLVAMRVAAGLVAGGIFPVAMALTGDLVPVDQRQVAIGRLLAVGLTGNLVGSSIAGVIGDLLGWRGVFAILGAFGLIVAIAALFAFRGVVTPPPARFNRAAVMANFRGIFADPRAKVCFTSVFFEAVFIHGLFPYVALLLLAIGEARASIAGLLIAVFAMGGVFYSLSVPVLIAHVREHQLMVAGGALAATGLILIALHVPWMWQIAVYGIFGFGFYLLHGCIQVHVTELSQTARGAAASLHSSFFYLGQAVGPVVYGYGFAHGGAEPSIFVGAAVVMTVGIACSRLLRHRTVY